MTAPFVVTRLFSLKDANALVPRLAAIFTRARQIQARMEPVVRQLHVLGHPAQVAPGEEFEIDPAAPVRVQKLQAEVKDRLTELRSLLHDVAQLGIEIKKPEGLVDFRSRLRGKTVYLCWQFGEERITHWHDLQTGLAGRKRILDADEFAGELLH